MASPHSSHTFADTKYVEMLALLAFRQGNTIAQALQNTVATKNAAPIAAANVVAFSSPGITRTGTGVYRISVGAAFTDAGATAAVTVNLLRDGVVLATAPIGNVTGTIGEVENAALEWIDTAPDALSHTYGIQLTGTGGGQTEAIATGQAYVVINEL